MLTSFKSRLFHGIFSNSQSVLDTSGNVSFCRKCHKNQSRVFSTEQPDTRSKWKSVIGLEVHAQINANSKLFSDAEVKYLAPPNSKVALFDAAVPGTLPILNRRCVEAGVITALSLSSKVNPVSLFDRKHYFYADLPAGYQITQQRKPLALGGFLAFEVFTPGYHKEAYKKSCQLIQLQLEQDSGRSLHDEKKHRSLIDLNRAGVALMELVFAPDLNDGEEAVAMIRELCSLLEALDVCSCKMEEGALRVDANISVCPMDASELGVRSEVKNIASARGVGNAVHFEVKRQIEILEKGGTVINETRFWDAQTNSTYPMREKEDTLDYRFMPEPNLLPLRVDLTGEISHRDIVSVPKLKALIPELPMQIRHRLKNDFKLSQTAIIAFMADSKLRSYFLEVMSCNPDCNPKIASNVLQIELLGVLNKHNLNSKDCTLQSSVVAEIVSLLQRGTINLASVRKLFVELIINNSSKTPAQEISKKVISAREGGVEALVEENQWQLITDVVVIQDICKEIIIQESKMVDHYKNVGPRKKERMFNSLMNKLSNKYDGKVDMKQAVEVMKELLNKIS